MVIKSLKLKNYRNYELLDMTFDSKTNILYGDNAQGKTNILEALYLSGTTKSHRGTKDRDLIQFGREESHLETIVEKRGWNSRLICISKRTVQKESQSIKFQFEKQVSCLELYILSFFSGGPQYYQRWTCRQKKIYRPGVIPDRQSISEQFIKL